MTLHFIAKILGISLTVIMLLLPAISVGSGLKVVSVVSDGTGITKNDAIKDAVIQAISQVNGAQIAASTMSSIKEQSTDSGGDSSYSLDESFQKDITTKTQGIVQGWTINSAVTDPDFGGRWVVSVTVDISQYETSKQLERMRLAFGEFKQVGTNQDQNNQFMTAFMRKFQDYLTQSRKFAILDREFLNQQAKELNLIASGASPVAELARLGNLAGTDYIIVGEISDVSSDVKMTTLPSGRTIEQSESTGRVSFKLIDIATSQVKFSETVFAEVEDSSIGDVARAAATEAGEKVVNAIFPIRVVGVNDSSLVLSQGGSSVAKGATYNLIILGNRVYDPYTKESLGREEKIIGEVVISEVTSKLSYADIIKSDVEITDGPLQILIVRPINKPSLRKLQNQKLEEVKNIGKKKVNDLIEGSKEDW